MKEILHSAGLSAGGSDHQTGLGHPPTLALTATPAMGLRNCGLCRTLTEIGVYGLLGVQTADAITRLAGLSVPWWACAFVAMAIVWWAGRRGIDVGAKILGVLLVAESAILALLVVAVIVKGGDYGLSTASFTPTAVFAPGMAGVLAFAFGVLHAAATDPANPFFLAIERYAGPWASDAMSKLRTEPTTNRRYGGEFVARPSKPILSPDLIYRTALNQLDRTGSRNMPELARELKVSVSSVYHHVKGRAGVLEGVRAVIADWDCGDPDDWEEMVRRWAGHYRDAFARHPGAIPALVGQAVSNPSMLRQYDALATKLTNTGFSAKSVVLSVSALDVLWLGAARDASAPSMVSEASPQSSSPLHDAAMEAGLTDDRSRAAFELQLGWVIAGMSELLVADQTERSLHPDLSTLDERPSSRRARWRADARPCLEEEGKAAISYRNIQPTPTLNP